MPSEVARARGQAAPNFRWLRSAQGSCSSLRALDSWQRQQGSACSASFTTPASPCGPLPPPDAQTRQRPPLSMLLHLACSMLSDRALSNDVTCLQCLHVRLVHTQQVKARGNVRVCGSVVK